MATQKDVANKGTKKNNDIANEQLKDMLDQRSGYSDEYGDDDYDYINEHNDGRNYRDEYYD